MYSSSRIKPTLHHKNQRSWPTQLLIFFLVISTSLLIINTRHHLPHTGAATADILNDSAMLPDSVNDNLVNAIIEKCMYQEDTIIAFLPGAKQEPVVAFAGKPRTAQEQTAAARCPLLAIPLAADDRSIGLCTDAALYVYMLGAWIVPGAPTKQQTVYDCFDSAEQQKSEHSTHSSAVLFLEPLYHPWVDWLIQTPRVVAAYAPNFEHVFKYDQDAHMRMQLVMCKVHRCKELMEKCLKDIGSNAMLIYTGHTSLDPLAFTTASSSSSIASAPKTSTSDTNPHAKLRASIQTATAHNADMMTSSPTESQQQLHQNSSVIDTDAATARAHLAAAVEPAVALHVRGKSSLKHTKQLLDCWITHPEWPKLTVVGPMPNAQITLQQTRDYIGAGNIAVPRAGRMYGAGFPEFDPVSRQELSNLLLSNTLHIMPSEREGFGHSINEGRAAGAVMLVPDHPPMNELVRDGSGLLIKPHVTFSHEDPPVPALGKYGNISASMSPQGICAAVSRALKLTQEERIAYGQKARLLFEQDRRDFERQITKVPRLVQSLAGGPPWQRQLQ